MIVESLVVEAVAVKQDFGHMEPGKGFNLAVREALAFDSLPGKGGIDDGEVAAPLHFAGELEVVKDAKDSLNYLH
jgi:hypothetical protein